MSKEELREEYDVVRRLLELLTLSYRRELWGSRHRGISRGRYSILAGTILDNLRAKALHLI
jgi:hypothetical protein